MYIRCGLHHVLGFGDQFAPQNINKGETSEYQMVALQIMQLTHIARTEEKATKGMIESDNIIMGEHFVANTTCEPVNISPLIVPKLREVTAVL